MAKNALGKGLKALIPDEEYSSSSKEFSDASLAAGAIGSLPVEAIQVLLLVFLLVRYQ